jgi:hypothetical protein
VGGAEDDLNFGGVPDHRFDALAKVDHQDLEVIGPAGTDDVADAGRARAAA